MYTSVACRVTLRRSSDTLMLQIGAVTVPICRLTIDYQIPSGDTQAVIAFEQQ